MRKYVELNGIVEIYEKTGNVPQSYLDYEKKYHEKIFGKTTQNKTWFVTCYTELWGCGNSAIMFNTCPFMWPGWNNKLSSMYNVGIYGVVTLYDRTFYRKPKLATCWNWGGHYINLFYVENMTGSTVVWY